MAFFEIEFGLRLRGSGSLQTIKQQWALQGMAERAGDFNGLIEAALPHAIGIQRHGNYLIDIAVL